VSATFAERGDAARHHSGEMWFSIACAAVAVELLGAVGDLPVSVQHQAPVAYRHDQLLGMEVGALELRRAAWSEVSGSRAIRGRELRGRGE